ncbi:MAG: hypothetical protein KDI62_24465 [Anaerolineae bacterium]|nr:hypothetical protein [Anaerolineae bacterium]MCB9107204.1 hypothetical protein [Anaerolineales bacterium]
MTFDDLDDLSSDQMLELLTDLCFDLWASIHATDDGLPDYPLARGIIRKMTYGIAKFRNVAAFFTADFEYSSIEDTQEYAREIASYLNEYGNRVPLPVYREFVDWITTTERLKRERERTARQSSTSLIEEVEEYLEMHRTTHI